MEFIKTLEITGKVHQLHIAFASSFQYNKVEICNKCVVKWTRKK